MWHLLIGICFAAPVGSALAPAGIAEAGIGGYVLAVVTGAALGAGTIYASENHLVGPHQHPYCLPGGASASAPFQVIG